MTEIEKFVPTTDNWVGIVEPVGDLASKIASTDFVPAAFKGKPAAVAAAILYGREVGLPPMSALKSINVIHGTPSLEAEAMRALILAGGHDIRFEEATATRCKMVGRRRGTEDWTSAQYTMDEAKQSGDFNKNPNYKSRPTEMLIARCTTRLARMIFPDVVGGLASPEDIDQADTPPPATPAKVTVTQAEKPARKPRKAAPKVEAAPAAVAAPAAIDGPPLPGEDGFEDMVPIAEPVQAEDDIIDAEVIEETGEAITPAQMKKLHATLRDLGIDNRDDGLAMIGDVLGEPVESTKALSKAQASMVIDTLSAMQAQGPAPF